MHWRKLLRAIRNLSLLAVAIGIVTVLGLLALVFIDIKFFTVTTHPLETNFNTGHNGLWLGSKWYQGKVSDKEIADIGQLLKENQIAFAYFHCRDINKEGKLRFHHEESAKKLVSVLHSLCPSTKVIAWVGAVNANINKDGDVDLSKNSVRHNMAAEAVWLTNDCGFQGIQWDFEPCRSGDESFVSLVKLTRDRIPKDANLGVAAPVGWASAYTANVCQYCDQLALMDYDTTIFWPRLYTWLVHEHIVQNTNALAKTNCQLIEGIATYDDPTRFHHKEAENMLTGVIGTKDGLADPRCIRGKFLGIAPYAEFTTTSDEWNDYRRYWLMAVKRLSR